MTSDELRKDIETLIEETLKLPYMDNFFRLDKEFRKMIDSPPEEGWYSNCRKAKLARQELYNKNYQLSHLYRNDLINLKNLIRRAWIKFPKEDWDYIAHISWDIRMGAICPSQPTENNFMLNCGRTLSSQ